MARRVAGVANARGSRHPQAMFDWSDLLLLLPNRVVLALLVFTCLLIALIVAWRHFH